MNIPGFNEEPKPQVPFEDIEMELRTMREVADPDQVGVLDDDALLKCTSVRVCIWSQKAKLLYTNVTNMNHCAIP